MQFNLSNNEEFIVQRGDEVVNIFDIEGGGGGDSTGKTDVTAFTAHTADTTVHVSTSEKNTWNGKQDALSNASVLSGISASDITNWNSKTSNVGTITGINMNGASKGTSGVVNLGTVITAETDPTVPAWAKETTKPSYTASEVGALPDTTVIPTTVASLTDSGNYTLTSTTNALSGTVTGHTADTAIHVTSNDKTAWNGKADNTAFTAHTASTSVHVSTSEKNTWNGKASASDLSTLSGTVTAHTADTTVHVTSGDKTSWNGKADNTAFTAHTASTSVHVSTAEKNTWNGKADNTAFTAHTASTSVHLPAVSSSDNGKVMMVSGGTWVLATPVSIYSGSDAPNNANGNNGDLYFQTL